MTALHSSGSNSLPARADGVSPPAAAAALAPAVSSGVAGAGEGDPARKLFHGEGLLRQVWERSTDWVALLDAQARLCWMNGCGVRLLGLENIDIRLNHFWLDFWSGEDAAAACQAVEAARAGGVGAFTGLFPTRDGDSRWWDVTVTPIMDGSGRLERLLTSARDVTGRRRTEAALRESEAKFQVITQNISRVYWQRDMATSAMVYVSPAYEKIWGRTCARLYAAPQEWSEAIHAEDRDRFVRAIATQLSGGTFDETYRIVRPDGSLRWIHDRGFPIHDDGGRLHRMVGAAEDITERRQLEEQVRQTHKLEAIGTLAGGIAHDFNGILTGIVIYTELARLKCRDDSGVREHLDAVLQSAKRAGELVKQILTFSRQQSLERRPMKIGVVVAEALKLLRASIPSTIEVATVIAADEPAVLGDATQIYQLVMNLGVNALQAMAQQPGRLEVRVSRAVSDGKGLTGSARLREGEYVCLAVQDSGCGMDRATLQRIFEPFFTTKQPGQGTGLGLAVVHGIVENHGGVVTVESEVGRGTVYHVYFPVHSGAEAVAAGEGLPHVPMGHGERLLVVDDEAGLVAMIKQALVTFGYQVDITELPVEALALVEANPRRYAAVITDQIMPGMTGLHLASRLHRIRATLPVILISGSNVPLTLEQIDASGITLFISKPMTMYALGAAVHTVLSAPART